MPVTPDLGFRVDGIKLRVIRGRAAICRDADDFAEVVAETLRFFAIIEAIARCQKKCSVMQKRHSSAVVMRSSFHRRRREDHIAVNQRASVEGRP